MKNPAVDGQNWTDVLRFLELEAFLNYLKYKFIKIRILTKDLSHLL